VPVVTDLERGLRELRVPFGIVGALVPELLLDARPAQMTNDADVTVVVQSIADFETLKDRLAGFGFSRTRSPHRMQHSSPFDTRDANRPNTPIQNATFLRAADRRKALRLRRVPS
jgi:hypothetical protein